MEPIVSTRGGWKHSTSRVKVSDCELAFRHNVRFYSGNLTEDNCRTM